MKWRERPLAISTEMRPRPRSNLRQVLREHCKRDPRRSLLNLPASLLMLVLAFAGLMVPVQTQAQALMLPNPGDLTFTRGVEITRHLPTATGGFSPYRYRLSPQVPGMHFVDPFGTRLFGTPTSAGEFNVTYTVTDDNDDTVSVMFTITVEAGVPMIGGVLTGHRVDENDFKPVRVSLNIFNLDDMAFVEQTVDDVYGTFTVRNFLSSPLPHTEARYTLDIDAPDTNALANGDRVERHFTVVSAAISTLTAVVMITIFGNNDPPTADAGDDQTVAPGDTVILDGSGSSDVDTGDSVETWAWSQTGGRRMVNLSATDVPMPRFTAPTFSTTAVLTFSLTVNDGTVDSGMDTVSVTVAAAPAIRFNLRAFLEGALQ